MIVNPNPDKIRFVDDFSSHNLEFPDYKYLISALEVSDSRSEANFITVFLRQGTDEDIKSLLDSIRKEPEKKDILYHNPELFHREDGQWASWTKWGAHYHILYKDKPTKKKLESLIKKFGKFIDPAFAKEIINSNALELEASNNITKSKPKKKAKANYKFFKFKKK